MTTPPSESPLTLAQIAHAEGLHPGGEVPAPAQAPEEMFREHIQEQLCQAAQTRAQYLERLGLGVPVDPDVRIGVQEDTPAIQKAFALLVEAIGDEAAARIQAGGGYPIKSKLWPDVVYVVPVNGRVLVLRNGQQVGASCLQLQQGVPWPDHVLTRIRAIENDETVVFCTGNM